MVRPESVLESWKTVREDTAQAVLDMPPGSLDFQPSPDLMKFRDLATHVLNAGRALSGLLIDEVDDMSAPGIFERMKTYHLPVAANATPEELARMLKDCVEESCRALSGKPPEFYAPIVTKWDGQKMTRLEFLQFTKEHELTHRSQMFVYLRLQGVVPPTTRRRMAKK